MKVTSVPWAPVPGLWGQDCVLRLEPPLLSVPAPGGCLPAALGEHAVRLLMLLA